MEGSQVLPMNFPTQQQRPLENTEMRRACNESVSDKEPGLKEICLFAVNTLQKDTFPQEKENLTFPPIMTLYLK